MYDAIKHIANSFQIKCSKYPKEELSPDFRDILFDEAFNEYAEMEHINSKLAERETENEM
jgi:hypothetical protein